MYATSDPVDDDAPSVADLPSLRCYAEVMCCVEQLDKGPRDSFGVHMGPSSSPTNDAVDPVASNKSTTCFTFDGAWKEKH